VGFGRNRGWMKGRMVGKGPNSRQIEPAKRIYIGGGEGVYSAIYWWKRDHMARWLQE